MYIINRFSQVSFDDFNQTLGLALDPDNEWVRAAELIPWGELERLYADKFKSKEGNVAKTFRMMLGASIIRARLQLSDRETVKQIAENPYFQYFIGCPRFQAKCPFTFPCLCNFRKRFSFEKLSEISEIVAQYVNKKVEEKKATAPKKRGRKKNVELTMILDATCTPEKIRFPQDESLLNEARENLERMIDVAYELSGDTKKPRTYRENARKDHLSYAKRKKRPANVTRKAIRKQLCYVARDLKYVDAYLARGIVLPDWETERLATIRKMYEQQLTMFKNKVNRIENRIVSLSQPHIRPVVRGKAKAKTEFGAKLDLSIDSTGTARLERVDFNAYNESEVLIPALKAYYDRNGRYPDRVLVDQIYRTKKNLEFCKEHGIRVSGPKLGRPSSNGLTRAEKRTEYRDNTDRIEVERRFAYTKDQFSLSLICEKLPETEITTIFMGIIASNVLGNGLRRFLCAYFSSPEFLAKFTVRYIVMEQDAA